MGRPALVIGASGMLGKSLVSLLKKKGWRIAELDIQDNGIDITKLESCTDAITRQFEPEIVINCAAMTDVDGCERDEKTAMSVNSEGPGNIARAIVRKKLKALLVHIGTDFVFDGGSTRPYTEADPPNPVSAYGRSKLAGEKAVAEAAPDHLIVRTSWLYGPGRDNFVSKVVTRARREKEFTVVDDQVGSPTYAPDLAAGILALVEKKARGLFHFANSGKCSKYEQARAALKYAGVIGAVIWPAKTALATGIARRPAFSVLDTSKFTALTGSAPRGWEEALKEYAGALKEGKN